MFLMFFHYGGNPILQSDPSNLTCARPTSGRSNLLKSHAFFIRHDHPLHILIIIPPLLMIVYKLFYKKKIWRKGIPISPIRFGKFCVSFHLDKKFLVVGNYTEKLFKYHLMVHLARPHTR